MNTLYDYEQNEYNGTNIQNAAEEAITFSKEVLTKMLKDIYDGMNVQDEIHREAFYETLRIFNEASAEGISQVEKLPSNLDVFLEQLRTNNEVFSAFRVHRMQNDMAKLMIGNDGQLKPFKQWKKDVKGITDHYVHRWLKTEYDTAVLRAHQAADWIRFREEKDVLPNLRWMPTTSPEPDQYHKQYWTAKLTLPVDHPFWKSHRPGDRWNCKCSLRQTDEPATTSLVADFKPIPAEPGLDNNPADDGKLFNDTHPYITHAHDGAKEAVNKLLAKKELSTAFDDKVTRLITQVEDEIRMNKSFETAVAIDESGNIIIDKRGGKFNVRFTAEECKKMENCVLTHNHPRGWAFKENEFGRVGNSFSFDDMMLTVNHNLAEMRAVTPLYTYSMKRPEGGWGVSTKTLKGHFQRQNKKLTSEMYDLIEKGYITPATANAIHWHILWQRIAKHYKWNYSKLKTK